MVINRIEAIKNIVKTQKTRRLQEAGKTARKDSVTLSSEAKELAELEKYSTIIKKSPDLRADKVAAAKKKIAEGSYFNRDVAESIAKKILASLGI